MYIKKFKKTDGLMNMDAGKEQRINPYSHELNHAIQIFRFTIPGKQSH